MSYITYGFLIWLSSILSLMYVSLGFVPTDNYLINCGSAINTPIGNRVFISDNSQSNYTLSTPQTIVVNTTSNPISSTFGSDLYLTARVFNGPSNYNFSIKKHGSHWIRLHFFPFVDENYDLIVSKFSVHAQSFTLLDNYQPQNVTIVKEYYLNISSDNLVLKFTPSTNSFAFLNALEVFSLPDDLLPDRVETIDHLGQDENLSTRALETVARVNMGNQTVFPQNDTLWRLWVSDYSYLNQRNLVNYVSNISLVNYTRGWPSRDIAPSSVYGTATRLDSQYDPDTMANVTWVFDVDNGFDYLIRFHFCDIVSVPPLKLIFNVYVNSRFAYRDLDLSNLTSNIRASPYYYDVIARLSNSGELNISVGPSDVFNAYPDGILNGLEIMKISNSRGSLAITMDSLPSRSKIKVWVIVGSAVGALFIVVILSLVVFLVFRSRRRSHVGEDDFPVNGEESFEEIKHSKATAIISSSKMGYRIPFVAIREATDNFSESLVIGIGGFGKVYKGVLRDDTMVAVKRGVSQSQQGLAEFRTEIEMLSQFRHRHLVSLIGYCDEQNKMIIIYEYMENGTLKNHLYGSNLPKLNWRQRLEICIGAARGLHYLHTGSAQAIIHRDVKSANILLDENLVAKVADFGLSKTGPEIDQTHVSTAVKGTFGYLDPEYLTRQQLTEKSDVYSFGVVLFEILSGKPVIDPSLPREMVNLVEWAMTLQKRGESEKIVDPHIISEIKSESLKKFGETAEKCLAERGVDRPTMGDVLWNLEYALHLQGNDNRRNPNSEMTNNHFETSVSTTQFSMGSMSDLDGVPMSRVFSQMVKAEMR